MEYIKKNRPTKTDPITMTITAQTFKSKEFEKYHYCKRRTNGICQIIERPKKLIDIATTCVRIFY
jgi:hypothetical protein